MVATRGRTFKRPWRRSCHSSKLKSSSAPIGRKDSWRFHAVGSSNAPLLGSTAAEGLQRIGRTSIATRWRSCGSPQSASCSENFVIPPDVFGQTLRTEAQRAKNSVRDALKERLNENGDIDFVGEGDRIRVFRVFRKQQARRTRSLDLSSSFREQPLEGKAETNGHCGNAGVEDETEEA